MGLFVLTTENFPEYWEFATPHDAMDFADDVMQKHGIEHELGDMAVDLYEDARDWHISLK